MIVNVSGHMPWEAKECCGPLILGAPLLSATGASTVGLAGAGGVFSGSILAGNVLSALPFVFSGLSALSGAQAAGSETAAQVAQLNAQAAADRANAKIARENAAIAQQQTQAELDKADRERRLRLGANIAAGGASGLGLGSASDILQSSAAQEELNLLTIQSEGLLRERSFLQTAGLDEASAINTQRQIPLVKSAGRTRSAASVLSGISGGLQKGIDMGVF